MFQHKSCIKSQNTHFIVSTVTFSENRAVYQIMWKNMVETDRPQMTIQRIRFAFWVTKVIETHSEYVTFIAVPRQQVLREGRTT